MTDTTLCQFCGAYSRRSCEYPEMTGMPREAAPCQFDDEWDRPDPDAQRDDRIDREMSHD